MSGPVDLGDELDLALAFARVRNELRSQPRTGRAIVANPLELDLVEANEDQWICDLETKLRERRWLPGPIELCDAPKGGGMVRPVARLGIADRVVYTAAVGACLESIEEATRWSQGTCTFAVALKQGSARRVDWIDDPIRRWSAFCERSIERVGPRSDGVVVVTDIAGFFEHISIELLASDLRRVGAPRWAVALVSTCLNAWAVVPGRGLPQSVMASDILARLYLDVFDREMTNDGFVHLRFVDDLRVFVEDEREAHRALIAITRKLRGRGLSIQTAKTQVLPPAEARREFGGADAHIRAVVAAEQDQARALGLMAADVSLPMGDIDTLMSKQADEFDDEILRKAYREFIVDRKTFSKRMFKFLLGCFGRRKDDYAVSHVGALLGERPELTSPILLYLERLGRPRRVEKIIAHALRSETGATYSYQRYLLLDWLIRNIDEPDGGTLDVVRVLAFDLRSPGFLKAGARVLVSRVADQADLEHFYELFRASSDPLERAQLLCCLEGLEKARRNSLVGRVVGEGSLVGLAANRVRAA